MPLLGRLLCGIDASQIEDEMRAMSKLPRLLGAGYSVSCRTTVTLPCRNKEFLKIKMLHNPQLENALWPLAPCGGLSETVKKGQDYVKTGPPAGFYCHD